MYQNEAHRLHTFRPDFGANRFCLRSCNFIWFLTGRLVEQFGIVLTPLESKFETKFGIGESDWPVWQSSLVRSWQ